ncbi:NAD-P-binding protein [Daedaleopsis nitida]|nr:NAD-P-binding protein [Daedaleopsis nitida]
MTESSRTAIFLTGATGYIGGAVLARLLNHPKAKAFDITVLVRNADKAKILESKFGVEAVLGTRQEYDKIHDLAMQSQVVFQLAESDDVPFAKALLSGMKDRHAKVGDVPILIHTSGTGLLKDDARGEYATSTIYSDVNVEQMKAIPDTAFHRNVDLLVMDADTQGYARSHIILPSTVYGIASNALVDAGVSNPYSMQVPQLVRASLDRKWAGVVGKGKAFWPDVHIDDVADLYIVLFDSIVNNPDQTGHGWEGFYFGENGEHTWYQLSKAVGEALVSLGITTEAESTTFTVEELVKYWGSEHWVDRGTAIGWKPRYTSEDLFKSVLPEVKANLNK